MTVDHYDGENLHTVLAMIESHTNAQRGIAAASVLNALAGSSVCDYRAITSPPVRYSSWSKIEPDMVYTYGFEPRAGATNEDLASGEMLRKDYFGSKADLRDALNGGTSVQLTENETPH